jgi:hypothetical protein
MPNIIPTIMHKTIVSAFALDVATTILFLFNYCFSFFEFIAPSFTSNGPLEIILAYGHFVVVNSFGVCVCVLILLFFGCCDDNHQQ